MYLRQETVKTHVESCEGSFVAVEPVEHDDRPTSAAQVGPSAGVSCDLPRNRPAFLGHYGDLLHIGSQIGLVQRSGGARHLLNSVRKLSYQASCFPNYKATHSMSLPVQILTRTDTKPFPVQLLLSKPG